MKIYVQQFENGRGIVFNLRSENNTEHALLTACVDSSILSETSEDNLFELALPVSMEA